jgi:hypothetical protein
MRLAPSSTGTATSLRHHENYRHHEYPKPNYRALFRSGNHRSRQYIPASTSGLESNESTVGPPIGVSQTSPTKVYLYRPCSLALIPRSSVAASEAFIANHQIETAEGGSDTDTDTDSDELDGGPEPYPCVAERANAKDTNTSLLPVHGPKKRKSSDADTVCDSSDPKKLKISDLSGPASPLLSPTPLTSPPIPERP